MSLKQVVLLTSREFYAELQAYIEHCVPEAAVNGAFSLDDLKRLVLKAETKPKLIAFCTGVIVPKELLGRAIHPSYNFHAASPDYPGRDPHHFAVYDDVRRYGATAHIMSERVDAGPIVGVEWFDVVLPALPNELLDRATEAAMRLFKRLVPAMIRDRELPAIKAEWGRRKTTRADFRRLCTISPDIDRGEFERRLRATAMPGHSNLILELHGRRFRLIENEETAAVVAEPSTELSKGRVEENDLRGTPK